jgi:hypothetical protein
MIVVIPTNRGVCLDYLRPLIDAGDRFIIVDDSEGSVAVDHPQFSVYSWQDRRRMLSDRDISIPKRNGACRDFGFYIAWKESDDDVVIALDDDCVVHEGFREAALKSLSDAPRPALMNDSLHCSVLDLFADTPQNLFPRGFPYSARCNYHRSTFTPPQSRSVKFSLGLWRGIFDVNAIDKLQGPSWSHPDAKLQHESVLVPPGRLISVCSGNMQFRREVLPAVYQLPMHVEALPGWVVDRYGDIWCGFILKTLMDLRGDAMAVGGPLVDHLIEGNNPKNIWKEHICHLVNDEFVGILMQAKERIRPAGYAEMMGAMNDEFCRAAGHCSPLLAPYLRHLACCLGAWLRALES